MNKLSAYLKTVVALAGTVLMVWNEYSPGFADILPAAWSNIISAVVGVLTVGGTFAIPNTTTDPVVAANQSVRLKPGRHSLPPG